MKQDGLTAGTVGRENDPEWDKEIGEDVKNECSKFGTVVHHYVDRNSQVCSQLLIHPLLLCMWRNYCALFCLSQPCWVSLASITVAGGYVTWLEVSKGYRCCCRQRGMNPGPVGAQTDACEKRRAGAWRVCAVVDVLP